MHHIQCASSRLTFRHQQRPAAFFRSRAAAKPRNYLIVQFKTLILRASVYSSTLHALRLS